MVNTFLTDRDFAVSASRLDSRRLGKQRVEAYQILNLLYDYKRLAKIYSMPIPADSSEYKKWTREIAHKYRDSGDYLFYHQKEWVWISRETKPDKLGNNEQAIVEGNRIKVCKKDGTFVYKSKYSVILPGDRLMTMGFCYHPCILMWLNHIDALKEYIDAHIHEWVKRGNSNNMKIYNVKATSYPSWVSDPDLHRNHKAALLSKEIARKEPEWYCNYPDFIKAHAIYDGITATNPQSKSDFQYYIWPYN